MTIFGGKKICGIVVSVKDSSVYPPEKIKPIISKLDDEPALTDECFALMRYIQKKYFVPCK